SGLPAQASARNRSCSAWGCARASSSSLSASLSRSMELAVPAAELRELTAQPDPRVAPAPFDRRPRQSQDLGDLRMGEAAEIAQHHHLGAFGALALELPQREVQVQDALLRIHRGQLRDLDG